MPLLQSSRQICAPHNQSTLVKQRQASHTRARARTHTHKEYYNSGNSEPTDLIPLTQRQPQVTLLIKLHRPRAAQINGREPETDRVSERSRQTERQTLSQTDRQTDRQTHTHTHRQTDRQTGMQADRQTGRQAGAAANLAPSGVAAVPPLPAKVLMIPVRESTLRIR
eukprot:COSAG03_NODE_4606_length_1492_cov_4.641780_4_plen_167_part_00